MGERCGICRIIKACKMLHTKNTSRLVANLRGRSCCCDVELLSFVGRKMRCGTRALSLMSLGFGLVATGALSLAVATDYWLFTVEQVPIPKEMFNESLMMAPSLDDEQLMDLDLDTTGPPPPPALDDIPLLSDVGQWAGPMVISMHSGLWRSCIINQNPGEFSCLLFIIC